MSAAELRQVILQWADHQSPAGRENFLLNLKPLPATIKTAGYDRLIQRVDDLVSQIDDGSFCSGWGWDHDLHDERDFGDESWAAEMDACLSEVRQVFLAGDSQLAQDLYVRLLNSLDNGHEPGHLPGDPDPKNMLGEDIREHLGACLAAVYLSTDADERPRAVFLIVDSFDYIDDCFELDRMINARRQPLPDINRFLADWLEFLSDSSGGLSNKWLQDALDIMGLEAQIRFALENMSRFPDTLIHLIDKLIQAGRRDETIQACLTGLEQLSAGSAVRAQAADRLASTAAAMGDAALRQRGLLEAFATQPDLLRLMRLLREGYTGQSLDSQLDMADAIITDKLNDPTSERQYNARRLKTLLFLFRGKYPAVIEWLKSLDDSDSGSENGMGYEAMIQMLLVLAGRSNHPSLDGLWQRTVVRLQAFNYGRPESREDFVELYEKLSRFDDVSSHLILSDRDGCLDWCRQYVLKYVRNIVDQQVRYRYGSAAEHLTALYETLVANGMVLQADQMIGEISSIYRRHSAFRAELKRCLKL